jgi:hypothetical protein
MKWGLMYYVRIFGVLMTGVHGNHKTTKMKPSFVSHEKMLARQIHHGHIRQQNFLRADGSLTLFRDETQEL